MCLSCSRILCRICPVIMLWTVCFLSVPLSMAQQSSEARMKIEKTNHDFGTLYYKDKPTEAEFRFTNVGNAPLVIIRSEVNCGCMSVKYPEKPVLPGQEGIITVIYNPGKGELGPFHKGIKIYSNAADRRLILFVEGEVVRK